MGPVYFNPCCLNMICMKQSKIAARLKLYLESCQSGRIADSERLEAAIDIGIGQQVHRHHFSQRVFAHLAQCLVRDSASGIPVL